MIAKRKSGSTANRMNRKAVLPFYVSESVWNQAFFFMYQQTDRHMRNHKGSLWKYGYRELFCGFSTPIFTYFRPFGIVMRTSDQTRPKTLLAAVNTFFTNMVILPPAVLAQEERPFQPPLLASAHRQSCSGTSRPGFLPSGGLCSAHLSLIHISEPTRQAEISYAVFCLKKKKTAHRRYLNTQWLILNRE